MSGVIFAVFARRYEVLLFVCYLIEAFCWRIAIIMGRAEEQAIKFVSRGLDEASSMSHRIFPHILPEPPHFVSSMLISARATPKIAGYTSHVAPGELVWD